MATVQQILNKNYSGKYQQTGYEKELKTDLNTLISAANKRLIKLRSAEEDTGITPGIIRVFENQGLFAPNGKFSSKGIDKPEDILNEINNVKRFLKAKTSTVRGFKQTMIKDIKTRLGSKFGWSQSKSQRKISTKNIKSFWETYNKLESSSKLKNGIYDFDSERIIKMLWDNSFGTGNEDINFDEVMLQVENALNEELQAYEEESKRKAAEITKYTGNIRF